MIKAKPNISPHNKIKQSDNQLMELKQCINRISGRILNHFKINRLHSSHISNQLEVKHHIINKILVQEVHNLSIVVLHNHSSSISNHNILKVVHQAITNLWTQIINSKVIEIPRNSETRISNPINKVMVGSQV